MFNLPVNQLPIETLPHIVNQLKTAAVVVGATNHLVSLVLLSTAGHQSESSR